MRSITITLRLAVVLVLVAVAWTLSGLASAESDDPYVCPPCGHDCLKTEYDAPGACGECGMTLVKRSSLAERTAAHAHDRPGRTVAVLLFEGVQIIDYTGPWEIFGHAGFEVFSVAKTAEPITTVFGMRVTPDHTIADHPDADILLIPGGEVQRTQNDPEVRRWLRAQAAEAEVVLSVCNGAFILAKAGLLDGLRATSTRHLVGGLAVAAPNSTIVRDVRWVDNGKIVTSGGLSAGMDAALHVAARYVGDERAEHIAHGLEYDWRQRTDPASAASASRAER